MILFLDDPAGPIPISDFLGRLQYPVSYLDFETFATAVPMFDYGEGSVAHLPVVFFDLPVGSPEEHKAA